MTTNHLVLTTASILLLSAASIRNVSAFTSTISSNRVISRQTQKQQISFIIKSSKDDSDDWYEGYDEFVKNLDFEKGGWDDSGPNMSSSSNNDGRQQQGRGDYNNGRQQRGRGGDRGGGGYGGGGSRMGYGGAHDYTRAQDDDTAVYVDKETVEKLLGERLKCRKTGEFERADGIRDQLLGEHGVTIWDKERVWTTNRARRGGSNRHGNNGRYGDERSNGRSDNGRYERSTPSRRRDFGPKGHDYRMTGGPIDESRCTISEDQIDQLIAERLQFKMSRSFREADAIQDALTGQGIFVNDGFKEWRGDGEDWGQGARGNNSRGNGDFGPREYSQRGPGMGLSTDEKELISGLVAKRSQAKATRDYDLADSVREQLTSDYAVTIDDKKFQWSLISEEYIFSSSSPNPLSDDVIENIQNQLADRSIAKQRRDFNTADDIRESLTEEYNVEINDREKEWSIASLDDEEYTFSSSSSNPLPDDVVENIQNQLAERSIAKQKRNFESADAIRESLNEVYNIEIDDRNKEWTIAGLEEDDDDSPVSLGYAEDDEEDDDDEEESEEEYDDEEEEEAIVSQLEETDSTITIESLNSLTVPQLKEKLRDVGLPVSGRKSELIERLTANSSN